MEKKGSKSSSRKEPKFIFRCLGDEIVHVNLNCVYESEFLYNFLEEIEARRERNDPDTRFDTDERDIGFIHQDIRSPKHIVSMVEGYCVGRFKIVETHDEEKDHHHLAEKLRQFDSEFVRDKSLSVLILLCSAAFQLMIKSLMNVVRNAIADMHDGEFAVKIPYRIKKSGLLCYVHETWTMEGIPFPHGCV